MSSYAARSLLAPFFPDEYEEEDDYDGDQKKINEDMARLHELLQLLKTGLSDENYTKWLNTYIGFFRGTIGLVEYANTVTDILGGKFPKENSEIRTILWEFANTDISLKKTARQNMKDADGRPNPDLTSVGDIRALLALKLAQQGMTFEQPLVSLIVAAQEQYVQNIVMAATPMTTSFDGFMSPSNDDPSPRIFGISDLVEGLKKQVQDTTLPEEARELARKQLAVTIKRSPNPEDYEDVMDAEEKVEDVKPEVTSAKKTGKKRQRKAH